VTVARPRQKIAGLPIGARKRSLSPARAARIGAMGATALAAVPVASRGLKVAGRTGEAVDAASDIKDAVSGHSTKIGKAGALVGAVARMAKQGGDGKPKLSHLIEEHTDIAVPRSVAYNQWTQMEVLPGIVKGVAAVEQGKDDETRWTSKIGPVRREWKAKITEQVPDERIAWKSNGGPQHEGVVTFHSLDEDLTHVMIQMHYVPHGPLETVGNKLRIQRRRVRRDLRLFKHFLELRGEETGAWRGQIGSNDSGAAGATKAAAKKAVAKKAPAGRAPAKKAAGGSARSRPSAAGRSSSGGRSANGSSSGRSGTAARRSGSAGNGARARSGGTARRAS
jgi:uncharacterized membrane protein